jgi:hypothetical protein
MLMFKENGVSREYPTEMELALQKMFPRMMKEFFLIENNVWKERNLEYMMEVCKKNPEYLLD